MTPSPDRCSECYVPAECVTTCGATGLPMEPVVDRSPSPEVVEALAIKLRWAWIEEDTVDSLDDCAPYQAEAWRRSARVAQHLINEAVEAENTKWERAACKADEEEDE